MSNRGKQVRLHGERQSRRHETAIETILQPVQTTRLELPLYSVNIAAGYPSPADDYIEGKLDLNEHLVEHPSATFFVRVTGDSMIGAGIHSGDLLVVDRALEPKDGEVVIAVVNGELLVKRLQRCKGRLYLVPDNQSYPTLEIDEAMEFRIWGVATNVIHSLR